MIKQEVIKIAMLEKEKIPEAHIHLYEHVLDRHEMKQINIFLIKISMNSSRLNC